MADFTKYIPKLQKWEGKPGKVTNHPADKGGATNGGVTLFTFRSFFGKDKTEEDLKNMTMAQWEKIMRTYWDRCLGDQILNQSVAEIIVDFHVNAGYNALKRVQGVLGVTQDGQFGPKTLGAINSADQRCLHCRIKADRLSYYENLAKEPSQRTFLKGWTNRVNDFRYEQ